MAGDRVDFFVSHAGADRAWAEWVAWQLMDAGYSVELDVWDWAAGQNFVTAMSDALERADRVVALFSSAYFERPRFTTLEWSSPFVKAPGLAAGRLVPVRVEEVPAHQVPPVLRPLVYCDIFGMDEEAARRALLTAVAGPKRPGSEPKFPKFAGEPATQSRPDGDTEPRRPGTMPRLWGNVPQQNPGFTGRDGLLVEVREALLASGRAAIVGMGGGGKTQLAIEYAHRFASEYDLVWWVNADEAGLIGGQLAQLAQEMGCAELGAGIAEARRAVLAELRQRRRWLLVFDNASQPSDVADILPRGAGHVLITSRARRWAEVARPVEVDVLARAESIAILMNRVPGLSDADADQVAQALGDLPLALAQAAGYMADTGTPAREYLDLLTNRAAEILDQGQSTSHPRSLAAVTQLAFDRLRSDDAAAAELAGLCAFFAPEPIPAEWFTRATAELPAMLAQKTTDPLAWRQVLTRISRSGLARFDRGGLQMHRLIQAIVRSQLPPEQAASYRASAEIVLIASEPGSPDIPSSWPGWARLLPHLLALDPVITANTKLRDLASDAAWYLIRRGDARDGHDLAKRLYHEWSEQLGPDDRQTLQAAHILAVALRSAGRYDDARQLDEDSLLRERRLRGDDHPHTLISASNLALDLYALGDYRAARQLDEDTLARKCRVLGEDHPDTLISANNLAIDLRELGDVQTARDLDEDTLARKRRVLGEDHPDTLISASNLAADLSALGDYRAARDLDEDTLARFRRVLGEDHPDTLISASNLAADLRALGEIRAARELDEDILARKRRVLGEDHPDTLKSASNLSADLYELGEVQAARDLNDDTLTRLRRVLGDDHPDTLASASSLATGLHMLDEVLATTWDKVRYLKPLS